MMVPQNATVDTPAPGVIMFHGISCAGHSMSNYAIELARRGYVVMVVDFPSSGYSDMVGQEPPKSHDPTRYMEGAFNALIGLNYVQKGNLTSLGFSAGDERAVQMAAAHKDAFNLIYCGYSNAQKYATKYDITGLNTISVISDSSMCGTEDQVSGNPENGDFAAVYYFRNYATHLWMTIFSESFYAMNKYIDMVNPAPISIPADNLVYKLAHVFSILGYIGVILLLITFAQLLLSSGFFKTLCRDAFPKYSTDEPKWMKILFRVFSLFMGVILMVILVEKLEIVPMETGLPAIPLWFNYYIPYFVGLGIFELLMFIFRFHIRFGKKQGGNLVTYGVVAPGGVGNTLKMVGKATLLGLFTAGVTYTVLTLIEQNLGVIFNVFDSSLNIAPAKLLVHSWFYILMYFFLFVTSNLNSFVANSEPENETRPQAMMSIVVKVIFTILPILILVGINTAKGMGWIPGKTTFAGNHLCGYAFMMTIATVVNVVITKKTKNIWAGAAICACTLGFAVTFGYAFQATLFG